MKQSTAAPRLIYHSQTVPECQRCDVHTYGRYLPSVAAAALEAFTLAKRRGERSTPLN